MNRIALAFRCFFSLLFQGALSDETVTALGLTRKGSQAAKSGSKSAAKPAPVAAAGPVVKTSDGALQMLGILQRDARLVDFVMEDITSYSDDQIGSAVRELHDQCRDAIGRYIKLEPVIDGVEGTFAKAPGTDAALVKFIGNVPAGKPSGGTLRHRGWKASRVDLPSPGAKQDVSVIAPAEIEIE